MATDFGLASAMQETPDFMVGPPKTPEEKQQRVSAWQQVIQRIQTDPNLQRAMFVMGASMLRPGANLGDSALAGFSAYEMGRQADQTAAQRKQEEQRAQELHQERVATSREDREYAAQRRPLEVRKLQAQIDAIPDEQARAALDRQLKEIELRYAPEERAARIEMLRSQAISQRRAGASAARPTDQQLAIQDYMNLPEIQQLPEAQRRAAATQAYMRDARGIPSMMRQEAADAEALSLYNYISSLPPEEADQMLLLSDAKTKSLYARGRELSMTRQGFTTQMPGNAPQVPAPAASSPVISAEEIRRQLSERQRTSSGKIRQGE